MKKIYMKPMVEIETYELSAAIAAGCGKIVNLGPGADGVPGHETCSDYEGAFDVMNVNPGLSIMATGGTPFYADGTANCDCYYSSGSVVYLTS